MQLSISTVGVIIANTTKLFFSSKELLAKYKMRNIPRKNLIIPTLFLMPCALLSLPVQGAEDRGQGTEATAATPATVTAPATTVATPATVTAPATTVATPATATAPATIVATPATATAPATIVATPATVTAPATTAATPATVTTPATEAAMPAVDAAATRPANEIGNLIASKQHPYLLQSDFSQRVADLDALYQASGYQPIWLSNDSKATKNIADIIKLLEAAPNHGLNAADYETTVLQQKLTALKPPLDLKSKDLALYDTAISLSLLRFMHDLHYGRINPRDLHDNIQLRTEKTLDLPALIKTSLAQDSLSKLPELAEPKLPAYQKLKQALNTYQVAKKTPPLNLMTTATIRPGNPLPQSVELQAFLSSLGYLPSDKIDSTTTTYTDTIVESVKKFQQQQGLKATGNINKATRTAFSKQSTPAQKVSQIELAMERLRWLPEIEGTAVMVNIPAFQLFAFDDINQDSPTTTMRVVVGKAAKNQTPLLTADMRFVDFQPYWNVPFKIARDEILPKLAIDPDYLLRQNMEFVSASGKNPSRIRQRPGKGNALGKVKFIFPNKSDVYLHDTPSVSLFGRSRRDLSHGCVRVAHPQELAEFVLKNEGDWDTGSIKKAMHGRNRRVILKDTIPVIFLYNTAFPDENNEIAFYSDIYHHDAKLLEALKKPRKDLSDKSLFAPKEVIPETDEQENHQIEASHVKPVSTASTKQEAPVVAATASAKPVSPAIEPVAVANVKQIMPAVTTASTEDKSASTPSP